MALNADISDLDAWVQQLMDCKPLAESDVKKLCDKVNKMVWGANLQGPRDSNGRKQRAACKVSR
jgi:hypothetical protein